MKTPVSGLIEMFLQRRAVATLREPTLEAVLEMRANVVRRPVAVCQANEQEGHGVKNQSEKTNFC